MAIEVLTAGRQVFIDRLAGAHFKDPNCALGAHQDVGAGGQRQAEDVAQDEHRAPGRRDPADGRHQACALQLREEHSEPPGVALQERVLDVDRYGRVDAQEVIELGQAVNVGRLFGGDEVHHEL